MGELCVVISHCAFVDSLNFKDFFGWVRGEKGLLQSLASSSTFYSVPGPGSAEAVLDKLVARVCLVTLHMFSAPI